jgi:hypothetical protein
MDSVPDSNGDQPELPIAVFTPPDFEDDYQRFADDLWLSNEYLHSGDSTVASLSWEGDQPGYGDTGFIERYEDRYVFWIILVDIFEDLGRFATTAEAIKSWRDRFEQPHYPPTITLETANWIGPIPE